MKLPFKVVSHQHGMNSDIQISDCTGCIVVVVKNSIDAVRIADDLVSNFNKEGGIGEIKVT